jgi:hypothetical protein
METISKDATAFVLTPEEKSQLLEAMAQADRGEFVDGWQLLAELYDCFDDHP